MFDAYRANKALEGQLRPGDSLQIVAVDDVTGDYWVVTRLEVILLSDGEIKSRFKELVKRHHPDANGGDRASEDKLREIIEAYNYLKSAGYC